MAGVLLFHHARGLTSGVVAFADDLRAAGHTVHTPDLYAGRTFQTGEEGVAHARELGFDTVTEAGVKAAEGLPAELVYAGFSLGVGPAQKLAQTRPGARGALLFHGGYEPTEFGPSWPAEVPVQIHAMADDPEFNTGMTCRPRGRWPTPPKTRRCSCIRATSTCSPTGRWLRTTPRPRP